MKLRTQILAIGVLGLIGILVISLIIGVYHFKNKTKFSVRSAFATKRHKPVSISDIVYISPWMTFDYINKLFLLPDNYLQESLQITDSKYPLITLGRYAKEKKISNDVLVNEVRSEVESYIAASSTVQQ